VDGGSAKTVSTVRPSHPGQTNPQDGCWVSLEVHTVRRRDLNVSRRDHQRCMLVSATHVGSPSCPIVLCRVSCVKGAPTSRRLRDGFATLDTPAPAQGLARTKGTGKE
jgi:hypothetical protein